MSETSSLQVRDRIIAAAAALIRNEGSEAATTRAVALAAGVQAPTLYRLIGDKDALLDAVAEAELAAFVAGKQDKAVNPDPIEALRHGWDHYVAFGLAHPALFRIMSRHPHSPAAASGLEVLELRIRAIAQAGRLRGSEERAVALVHAAATGAMTSLIAQPSASMPFDLAAQAREAIIAAITTAPAPLLDDSVASAAATLRARLGACRLLSAGELALMDELLLRLSSHGSVSQA
ncbi:TetR/AcrR family transcriptional regulator [Pseudomonas sp. dw_358]|uniref:TetR/AcrR family transcriptional regulator n=1 Tax=Pseudomonas sp. dw_358 TaxID=2720083 RepID=UPI001BD576A9|nr:TetR/AcrR family transcriptional regulator [Pseudomonas sp. dw_358]